VISPVVPPPDRPVPAVTPVITPQLFPLWQTVPAAAPFHALVRIFTSPPVYRVSSPELTASPYVVPYRLTLSLTVLSKSTSAPPENVIVPVAASAASLRKNCGTSNPSRVAASPPLVVRRRPFHRHNRADACPTRRFPDTAAGNTRCFARLQQIRVQRRSIPDVPACQPCCRLWSRSRNVL
jgi:hypothetical protein